MYIVKWRYTLGIILLAFLAYGLMFLILKKKKTKKIVFSFFVGSNV